MSQIGLIASIVRSITNGNLINDPDKLNDAYNTLKELSSKPNSISRKAKAGIFEYPFLISSNITDIESIAMLIKAIEIDISQMVQISMGIAPTSDPNLNIKIQQTLSNFHTNSNDYSFNYENVYHMNTEKRTLNELYNMNRAVSFEANPGTGSTPPGPPSFLRAGSGPPRPPSPPGAGSTPPEPPSPPIPPPTGSAPYDSISVVKTNQERILEKYISMYNSTIINIELRIGSNKNTSFSFPIGIKGIAHHLPYDELLYIISSYIKQQTTGQLVRYLKWRSGEINTLQMFFGYNDIISDINFEKRVGANKSWLKVLRSRGYTRKMNQMVRLFGNAFSNNNKIMNTSEILPNCTFVLSIADIDLLENQTGVNLFLKPREASKFLDEAMGLCICIVDDIHSVVHIMYSSYTNYNSVPFSNLGNRQKKEGDMTKIFLDIMKKVA